MSESGVIGGFASGEELVAAVRAAPGAGFSHWETFTPYGVEELVELRSPREGASPVARAMAAGGCLSAGGAFGMQYWATHVYPLEVGSRPLNSWPAFIPITFELGVLGAALTGVATLLILARFPRLHHPVFAAEGFRRASQDRFFLLLYADAPGFAHEAARRFLQGMGATGVGEVTE